MIDPKKLDKWYNQFCVGLNKSNPEKLYSIQELAEFAAMAGYGPSVKRANPFPEGLNVQIRKKCRAAGEKLIADSLLIWAYNKFNNIDEYCNWVVGNVWKPLKEIYTSNGVKTYKFGHAQKWFSVAMKYFVTMVLKSNNSIAQSDRTSIYDNTKHSGMVIDGIMLSKLKAHGIELVLNKCPICWTKCDNASSFTDLYKSLEINIKNLQKDSIISTTPFEYEYNMW